MSENDVVENNDNDDGWLHWLSVWFGEDNYKPPPPPPVNEGDLPPPPPPEGDGEEPW